MLRTTMSFPSPLAVASAQRAAFPEYGDANSLNEAADKALYQAKRSGRNQLASAPRSGC
ncbi:MAG: hypothetical protein GDA56_22175 [Hormoscilla sp. GM7CHS1pb]|nr:hypothetical protein [Hormoscilla sp. GM7CHS1pb]